MKLALVQQTGGNATGNQDYTDGVFSSDVKLAVSFNTIATANDTSTNQSAISVGAATATVQRVSGCEAPNGATSAGTMTSFNHSSTSNLIAVPDNNSSTPNSLAAFGSFQATGVRANWSTAGQAALINMLLLGGSDTEATLVNQTLNTGSSPVTTTVTHGLSGGAPHVIWVFASLGSVRVTHGFYHVGDGTYACSAYCNINGVNPVLLGGYVGNDAIGAQVSNSAVQYKLTVANVGATTFDLVATGTTIEADVVSVISIRNTNAVFRVGVHSTPTGTGTANVFPDTRNGNWKGLILLPSRLTTVNTYDGGDAAGVFGMGAATYNGTSTAQACSSLSSDDGASTSVERSVTSNAKCLSFTDVAGTIDVEAALSSWATAGPILNYTNVNASSFLVPYLALAEATTGAKLILRDRFTPGQHGSFLGGVQFH